MMTFCREGDATLRAGICACFSRNFSRARSDNGLRDRPTTIGYKLYPIVYSAPMECTACNALGCTTKFGQHRDVLNRAPVDLTKGADFRSGRSMNLIERTFVVAGVA